MSKLKTPTIRFKKALNYHQKGEAEKASEIYRQILKSDPNFYKAANNLGIIIKEKGDLQAATEYFKLALKTKPKFSPGHNNLGNTHTLLRQHQKALKHYQQAIKFDPGYTQAYLNLGSLYHHLGQSKLALDNYHIAYQLDPTNIAVLNNLGAVQHDAGLFDQSISTLDQAVQLSPDSADIHYNLARSLQAQKLYQDALYHYQQTIDLNKEYFDAYPQIFFIHLLLCDWSQLNKLNNQLTQTSTSQIIKHKPPGETPLLSLIRQNDPKWSQLICQSWSEFLSVPPNQQFSHPKPKKNKYPQKKINIGYLSANLDDHPVGQVIVDLFKQHDQSKFNINVYAYNLDSHPITKKIKSSAHKFTDISEQSYRKSAQTIFQDKVDILVDLMGYTKNHRFQIVSYKPSPIIINYLGFPGSLGSNLVDYIITDKLITPPSQQSYYSEKFIYLPNCYQVNSRKHLSPRKFSRSDFQLPQDKFIYVSINKTHKLEPNVFTTWLRILKQTPNSVLWLFNQNPDVQQNLRQFTQSQEVDPLRLIFSPQLPLQQHLKRLQLADLGLDTFLYNGGASTSHSLWAGLPVLTLKGNSYISRMSTSILHNFHLPQLIANTKTTYRDLAQNYYQNPHQLTLLKQQLKKNRLNSPLFNLPQFTLHLEQAYQAAYNQYASKQSPQPITISA